MESTTLNKHAIRWGAIIGVAMGLLMLLIYVVSETSLVSMGVGFGLLFLSAGVVVYAGINYRKSIGNYINFKNAFVYSIIVFVVAGLIGLVFRFLLFHVIDTALVDVLVDASIENTEAIMESFGMPEDQMDKALGEAEDSIRDSMSVGGMVKGYAIALIFYAILSLITGAIIKKKEPEM